MVVEGTAYALLMPDRIIQVHRAAACYHEAIRDPMFYEELRNIIGYLDLHGCFLRYTFFWYSDGVTKLTAIFPAMLLKNALAYSLMLFAFSSRKLYAFSSSK